MLLTNLIPGPPASVLAAILRENPAHPYDGTDPAQRRRATFSGSNFPDLPSLTNDVIWMPRYAYLDANIATTGIFLPGGASYGAVLALPYATTIAVDAALATTFTITLTGDGALANPTSSGSGQQVIFAVTQDSTGSRALSYGTAYAFSASLPAPVLSATPGATDYLGFKYSAASGKWNFIAFVGGFT